MLEIKGFLENDDIECLDEKGSFKVIQWKRDLSVTPWSAQGAWFADKMNVRRRQLVCDLDKGAIRLSPGAMQWMAGDVKAKTGIKGAGDLMKKTFRGVASNEGVVKPEYSGSGILVTEPTYRFVFLCDLKDWGGSVVLDDGIFLACDAQIKESLNRRTNLSSAVMGREGLFNLQLSGKGVFVLESPCPLEEIITVDLNDDELKIDGNYAIMWSPSLKFTVERTTKTLIGSAASGEGFVNVYRGTGRVMLAPMRETIYNNINKITVA